jgi:hypothetical protein
MTGFAGIRITSCQLQCTEKSNKRKRPISLLVALTTHIPYLTELSFCEYDYLETIKRELIATLKKLPELKTLVLEGCKNRASILAPLMSWKKEQPSRQLIQKGAPKY